MLAHRFGPLLDAVWLERRQRFLLDVALADGTRLTAHCPNTGAMTGLTRPDARVLLSRAANPKRRLAYTLEAVEADGVWVGANTQNPNRVALALARAGHAPLPASIAVRPEVRYGTAERVDLLLTGPDGRRTFVEVKNVHLVERAGEASFPDCVTLRGAKHLAALAHVVAEGERAMMLFLIQRHDCEVFRLARHIDPAYAAAFDAAAAAGVAMVALRCRVDREGITAERTIPVLDLATGRAEAAALPTAALGPT
ncbi:DNA/RNA nuclease SfsA [Acuticoccus sp.]|uniref:DNA/RNA nuclease SfsA n=1 Tax=Acuticoccus sp. TaxID=1904378 RepID=UPI003B51E9FE